jgi:dTDP-4-amino-4,6-dideoxygalactose transaminase
MSNLQAEFLRIKLRDFDRVLAEKRKISKIYQQAFGPVPLTSNTEHSWHVYPLLVKDRSEFVERLKNLVEIKSHYARAVHQYPAFATQANLPVTEWVAAHQVSVPIYPGIDHAGVIEAIAPLRDCFTEFPVA